MLDDTRRYTCLTGGEEGGHICTLLSLYRIDARGTVGERIWEFQFLTEPPDWVSGDPAVLCRSEWLDYGGHAGLVELPAEDTSEEPLEEPSSIGCESVVRGRPLPGVWLVFIMLSSLVWASRRQ